MKQLALSFPAFAPSGGGTIQEQFEQFHAANPWVFDALVERLEAARDDGATRVGIKHLFEVLRWDYRRATRSDDWRLNNNYTSRYARLIAERRPELAGLLEMRGLKAR